MILKEIVIENFRAYRDRHRIPIGDLTAFIGKNDAGKSSVFDAPAVFFDHPLGKIDDSDICVHAGDGGELRVGCVFTDFPDSITIDETSETTLADEHLLNEDGHLEIHKVFDFSGSQLKKPRVVAVANHPTAQGCDDLLSKKNSDLKNIGKQAEIDEKADRRSNVALRRAIWDASDDLRLREETSRDSRNSVFHVRNGETDPGSVDPSMTETCTDGAFDLFVFSELLRFFLRDDELVA